MCAFSKRKGMVVNMKEVLKITNLNYQQYHNFSLCLNNERFISIIGPNMCGKTTLLKIISCIIPTENMVSCNGIVLNKKNINQYIKRLGIVLAPSKESFLFETVYEEMSYPLKNLAYRQSYIDKQIDYILKLLELDIKDKQIKELSNYEKQTLLIAISLLHKPKLLLIDDIFSYMEDANIKKIVKILKSINNLTTVYFSSNLNLVNESDYIYILNNGEIYMEGNSQNISNHYDNLIDIGLEIPFINKLSIDLKKQELIKKDYSNLEDLVNNLWK